MAEVLKDRGQGILDFITNAINPIKPAYAPDMNYEMMRTDTGFSPVLDTIVAQDATPDVMLPQIDIEAYQPPMMQLPERPEYASVDLMPQREAEQRAMYNRLRGPGYQGIGRGEGAPQSASERQAIADMVNKQTVRNQPQDAGLLGQIGSRVGSGLGAIINDPITAPYVMEILNQMRNQPNQFISKMNLQRIEAARETEKTNRTADYLESIGKVKEAEMIRRFPEASAEILSQVTKVPDWRSKMDFAIQNPELAKQARDLGIFGSGTTINVGGQQMTPGREAMDKEYAKEHVAWVSTGGADMSGQLAQIQTVLDKLEGGEQLTGPTIGMAPDFYLYLTNPEAVDARQRVEEVVQRNLRVILGAQFTEKEGERLISRAYDPKLSPEQNAARLRRLITQMRSAVDQKNEMARYFEEYGTLAGYVGKRPSVDDFYRAIEGQSRSALKAGDIVDGWVFMGGDPGDEGAWKKKGAE